jgi:hypothetical protein
MSHEVRLLRQEGLKGASFPKGLGGSGPCTVAPGKLFDGFSCLWRFARELAFAPGVGGRSQRYACIVSRLLESILSDQSVHRGP